MIYFDNAATTRPSEAAVRAAVEAMESIYYNPSSLHRGGLEAEKLLRLSRRRVADALGASPDEILFTSGGTEGDNLVFHTALSSRARHVIVSAMEHEAVLSPAKALEAAGVAVSYAKPNEKGIVTPEEILSHLRPDTYLVSLMLVNNETGSIQPLREIAAMLKRQKSKALLHTDAVQGFLKTEFIPSRMGVDLATVSAHKVHGLKGSGALWHRKDVRIRPMLLGGGQEKGLRSGTEAMPALAAFGAACEEGRQNFAARLAHVKELHAYGTTLLSSIPGVELLPFANQSPYMLTLSLPGYKSEVCLHALEQYDICVSSGAACAKGKISHVLSAVGVDHRHADAYLRVSLSHENTKEELNVLADALKALLPTLVRID